MRLTPTMLVALLGGLLLLGPCRDLFRLFRRLFAVFLDLAPDVVAHALHDGVRVGRVIGARLARLGPKQHQQSGQNHHGAVN